MIRYLAILSVPSLQSLNKSSPSKDISRYSSVTLKPNVTTALLHPTAQSTSTMMEASILITLVVSYAHAVTTQLSTSSFKLCDVLILMVMVVSATKNLLILSDLSHLPLFATLLQSAIHLFATTPQYVAALLSRVFVLPAP